jgi:hypothetical protein
MGLQRTPGYRKSRNAPMGRNPHAHKANARGQVNRRRINFTGKGPRHVRTLSDGDITVPKHPLRDLGKVKFNRLRFGPWEPGPRET